MIQKRVVETKGGVLVRVTFSLPNSIWADRIRLVGDFNHWDRESHPMRRGRDGIWRITVDLEPGRAYHFRYLCDEGRWMNDTQADAYVPNSFGSDNFVVRTDLPVAQSPGTADD